MKFIIEDRRSIERGIIVKGAYVVISVRDPGSPKPRIRRGAGLRDILYLEFHDAEPRQGFALPEEIVLMSPADAAKIWTFVNRWEKEIEAIVCHCEQGMSRSPAVAIGIAKALGQDATELASQFQPNQYVESLVAESALHHRPGLSC